MAREGPKGLHPDGLNRCQSAVKVMESEHFLDGQLKTAGCGWSGRMHGNSLQPRRLTVSPISGEIFTDQLLLQTYSHACGCRSVAMQNESEVDDRICPYFGSFLLKQLLCFVSLAA